MTAFDLVVVSHLRWDFVWQRPQQVLSRLAKTHRILFVEEPEFAPEGAEPVPNLRRAKETPNIIVLTPQISAIEAGETPLWLWPSRNAIAAQVKDAIQTLNFKRRALWMYTPTPEFMVGVVAPDMLVYDVMDELANFKFAPAELKDNEKRLLGQSAVVFTGGASLYDSKKHLNPNTHLFSSGVDGAHYAKACDPKTSEPEWMNAIPSGPRATYIGVIDERLDHDLIGKMAAARPDVQFLICGPIVKVDPAHLPQAANLHYPGQQGYDDLPRILSGTDICLMPFAMNEATKYISPTKTLEYMAAHKPIVSTPINDVIELYGSVVRVGNSAEQFAGQVRAALLDSPETQRMRENELLQRNTWDSIATRMGNLINEKIAEKLLPRTLGEATFDQDAAVAARR